MVRIAEVIDPRPELAGRFDEPYLRLADELARRGWLPAEMATKAADRASDDS
jgi:hypothetical protein